MLNTRLHYAHVCARLLCQPVDAQVEIVLQTANGQKVRPIARQNGGGEEVAGSSRLKAMKVCPRFLCGRGCGRGGGTTFGAAELDCMIAVLHTSSDGVSLWWSLHISFLAVHLSRRPTLPMCVSLWAASCRPRFRLKMMTRMTTTMNGTPCRSPNIYESKRLYVYSVLFICIYIISHPILIIIISLC